MNAELKSTNAAALSIDDGNPWIGLASFTEETRDYFYGREDEVAELARRVQRKLLTVLFGQSGLGKTSILRAGLVPRLRDQGYCPVYVRVDYSKEAPEPAEQLKQAIAKSARRSGQWTQAGVAVDGETLWEFLHHRDDMLKDEQGKTLIPLLIFDQFEEVFTVAQSDEFGRARAARFIADLADLVENRPPASFEAKLEADEALAEKFDFARSDYRVLISLREDYLAPLEGLKANMPSVTQNRLRLAPMNGKQGLEAVMRPGKKLVSPEVAEAIVRFVAGGSEIANAEVEPSLLSLICRELNDTRKAQGRSAISLDLLAGSHATILSNFYERALADQPAAVRRIIEDELLTESGFRENVAEERLQKSFTAAGAAPDTLATLVNRRLLRIEERLDVRRVELTHDVLCGVVKSSRDVRLEREQREAAEKSLAEQKDRAQRTRTALIRARQIATVCIVLAIGAIAAAVFAYFSSERAKRAEATAQTSRTQAEQLLGFLTDDFASELESSGRLEVVQRLAEREVDYFRKLPADLRGPSTIRMGATALQQYARSSRSLGKIDEASKAIAESEALLSQLQKDGDTSEATALALIRAMIVHATVLGAQGDKGAIPKIESALGILKPLAAKADASIAVREVEAEIYDRLGYFQQFLADSTQAIPNLQRSMDIAARHGALDLSNLRMAEIYVDSAAWAVQTSVFTGRYELAEKTGAEGTALAQKILALRPGNKRAITAQAVIATNLTGIALDQMRPAEALEKSRRAVEMQQILVSMDPGNTVTRNNFAAAMSTQSDAAWSMGRIRDSINAWEVATESIRKAAAGGAKFKLNRVQYLWNLARRHAEAGDFDAVKKAQDEMVEQTRALRASLPKDSLLPDAAQGSTVNIASRIAWMRGDARESLRLARELLPIVEAIKKEADTDNDPEIALYYTNDIAASAAIDLGDFAAVEKHARAALESRKRLQLGANWDALEIDMLSGKLAIALAALNRRDEAARIMEPVVKRRRDVQSRNHGDVEVAAAVAAALYVQGLIDPRRRDALLNEAATIISGLPREYRNTFSTRYLSDRISDAQLGVMPWHRRAR